ncbi:NUDIX domain-containing protein [soil metagenome]
MAEKKLIDLYPYKTEDKNVEFLLFRREEGKIYEGQWRMIGGKVKPGESYWEAALRELKEETDLQPEVLWTVPSVNQFYEHQSDTIHTIPAFAAEIAPTAIITLDDEHREFQWIKPEEVSNYIQWPEQIRLIKLTNQLIISNQILDDWRVPLQ